jgi:hypothetical protein
MSFCTHFNTHRATATDRGADYPDCPFTPQRLPEAHPDKKPGAQHKSPLGSNRALGAAKLVQITHTYD